MPESIGAGSVDSGGAEVKYLLHYNFLAPMLKCERHNTNKIMH